MTMYKLIVLTYLVLTTMVDLVYGQSLRLSTAQTAKYNVFLVNQLMINLLTMQELCNVTYLVRTAMVNLVYGDVLGLPTTQKVSSMIL